ncbi:pheromone-regulated protein prm10 [Neophaeococcomyces mojaviensis]|uniref:Pheromone-regulated protein prm10 n=1 Tax=Neophaeococcomyces mojaviensis TaxID=3383035 RepID=A0ACC3A8W3_9EURO|nr:pheromone-regulated protein prm10 [Knufia sp. JES_112]
MNEDNDSSKNDAGRVADLESGLGSRRPLHSWSSYTPWKPIHFRTPDYGKSTRQAPHLAQEEFSKESTLNVENYAHTDPQDTDDQDRSRQHSSASDDQESPQSAALVGSSHINGSFHELEGCYGPHRYSSSSSSYSSHASDNENPVSTRRLIQYYTSCSNDTNDEFLTARPSRFPTNFNAWHPERTYDKDRHALHVHLPERPRQGSLPPPYQPGSRKSSYALPYIKPYEKASPKSLGRPSKRSINAIEKNAFLLKICKSFLLFGVQAHRLEEYLHITAAKLKISAEFQYVPHCMLIVLTNPHSQINEFHLVKESTTIDLGKLEDVYQVYEAFVEDDQDLQTSIRQLDSIVRRRRRYTNFLLILLHGLAALCAGAFAFSARPIDFGPLFVFGCMLAILQLLVLRTPIRNSHILEVITAILVAFSARALGSIQINHHEPLFCFSGITQGVIALILPGHIILAATHEIQNRQVLSGSVKMIYSILYTMFLGFGILIGTVLFGFIDHHATNQTTCSMPWYWDTTHARWRATYSQFIWVPIFALAISIMHQAKPKHLPAMVFIGTCGHQAFYWSLSRFAQNLQFAGMIAAFASGLLANIYSRLTGCLAATILMPAVLIHIPNALAASGSLVAGVSTADAIVSNATYWIQDQRERVKWVNRFDCD